MPSLLLSASPIRKACALVRDVTLMAEADDLDGHIGFVAFFEGLNVIATVVAPPYSMVWSNVALGRHAVRAEAWDNYGYHAISEPVRVQVGFSFPDAIVRGPAEDWDKARVKTMIDSLEVK